MVLEPDGHGIDEDFPPGEREFPGHRDRVSSPVDLGEPDGGDRHPGPVEPLVQDFDARPPLGEAEEPEVGLELLVPLPQPRNLELLVLDLPLERAPGRHQQPVGDINPARGRGHDQDDPQRQPHRPFPFRFRSFLYHGSLRA